MSQFTYFPHTEDDVRAMLEKVGAGSIDELYADVPAKFFRKHVPALPDALSEQQVREYFESLGSMVPKLKVFAGAGAYDHYTPSVIPYITSRSEFLTAYTPYQCEISQGTLRYIFEYQSLICSLTGLDVSNASLYDGPTAAAEAMKMCLACTRKKSRVLLSDGLLPQVKAVVETYAKFHGVALSSLPLADGVTNLESLKAELASGDVAGVILPQINRFGLIEDHSAFAAPIHEASAIMVEYCDPSALAVLKTPAELDADIAVGDGQSLGIPLCYGGPYLGFMAVKKDYMRKMPGRIVGKTTDKEGRRAFVLTLQAREQHIRREKATSNICSNESLMALWVTVYLSLMGPQGMKEVNSLSYDGAHYLKAQLLATGFFKDPFPGKPFLKEFVLEFAPAEPLFSALLRNPVRANAPKSGSACALQEKLAAAGFFGAVPTKEGYVSFCVTEKRTLEEIDALVKVAKEG